MNRDASDESGADVLPFLRLVGRLKQTKRTGWVRAGVREPESVADHMYRMALVAFVLSDGCDARLIKMALAHDLAEAVVGDITPHCGVSKEEKARRERDAMLHVRHDLLGDSRAGRELFELWSEYEAGASATAKLLKDIDKFEMILQADEYEQQQAGIDLEEFYRSAVGSLHTSSVQRMADDIVRARVRRLRQREASSQQQPLSPPRHDAPG